MLAALILLALTGASYTMLGQEKDSELTVMVVKGIDLAPTDMKRAESPVARFMGDSRVIAFVSSPLYSGSCPPTAEAEAAGDGTVTMTISNAAEGPCTADANRDTFLVQGFSGNPTHLIVREQGQKDLEFDVSE